MEKPHGVRSTANSRNKRVRQPAFRRLHLLAHFLSDYGLKVAHHGRVGVRTRHRSDDVEGVFDIRHPVAQRLVHGVFQGSRARNHRAHFCAEQAHTEHVRALPLDIGLAHIDDARKPETRGHCRHGDAVLACARFGDNAAFAHAHGEQNLTKAVIDLMRAGMIEFVAFEVDLRAAEMRG